MKKLMEILGDKRELCRLLNEHKDMLKKVGIVVLVIVLGLVVSAVKNGGQEEAQAQETTVAAEEETAEVIYVDVGGEVNQPSVVELTDGSRVTDAIAAAGGLTEKADLTDINRAAFVSDGEKIFIPSQEEYDSDGLLSGDSGNSGGSGASGRSSDGKININTADLALLMTLPGIGESKAGSIISYREEHGKFSSIEELMNITGIKEGVYTKIKEHITVN